MAASAQCAPLDSPHILPLNLCCAGHLHCHPAALLWRWVCNGNPLTALANCYAEPSLWPCSLITALPISDACLPALCVAAKETEKQGKVCCSMLLLKIGDAVLVATAHLCCQDAMLPAKMLLACCSLKCIGVQICWVSLELLVLG